MNYSTKTTPWEQHDTEVLEKEENQIIVWNDDVNTFDWVIECLVEICNHNYEQAEQCAYFIHHLGKYAVKSGAYEKLKPMHEALLDRSLSSEII